MNKLFGWLFVLIAIPLGFFTLSRSYDKLTSESWPSTYAEVLTSEMYQRTGRSHDWCVKLNYKYVLDGRALFSRRLSTSLISDSGCDPDRKVIAARLERLQPGEQIKIRYHPTNPERSAVYLDEMDLLDYLLFGIALVVFVAGIKAIKEADKEQA